MTQLPLSLQPYHAYVEKSLANLLASLQPPPPSRLEEAMRYSVLAGGKRLRPILVMIATDACGGNAQQALPWACALEFLHTYSLIHDDLPAMDNDDMRRGKPTNHRVFGEGMAILAGDALLTEAFGLLVQGVKQAGWPGEYGLWAVQRAVTCAGAGGMIAGQVADITSSPQASEREWVYARKTSRLFELSAYLGGLAAQAPPSLGSALIRYATALGLAFQFQDDWLDEEMPRSPLVRQRMNELWEEASQALASVQGWVRLDLLQDFLLWVQRRTQ